MRSTLFWAFLLPVVVSSATVSAQPDATRFDGAWDVVLTCPKAPEGALPFTWDFTATVKNAALHGEHGQAGQPGWMSLDGTIAADGTATMDAHGLTGNAAYNVNQTARGVAYDHTVNAHFDSTQGTGNWVTSRTCNFTFTKT